MFSRVKILGKGNDHSVTEHFTLQFAADILVLQSNTVARIYPEYMRDINYYGTGPKCDKHLESRTQVKSTAVRLSSAASDCFTDI